MACLLSLPVASPPTPPTPHPLPAQVRLVHKDTGAYLSNHNVKYQRPIPGHTEVRGVMPAAPLV